MLVGSTGNHPACPCIKTALTAYPFGSPEFNLVFSGTHDAQSLVFCVVFWAPLFLYLSLFFWSLYCQSLFNVPLLITPLVYSNFS